MGPWERKGQYKRRLERGAPAFHGVVLCSQESGVWRSGLRMGLAYFMCLETSLVISNIETCFLPPKIFVSLSSALIMRLLVGS